MSRLELHFSGSPDYQLQQCVFSHPLLGDTRTAVRGKTSGAFQSAYTFQWTQGVISLAHFLVSGVARRIQGKPEGEVLAQGEAGSLAASLDYSIAKSPQWIHDLFGTDRQGVTLLRRLVRRTNSERRRPGPVSLSLNPAQLTSEEIAILIEGVQVEDAKILTELLASLTDSFFGNTNVCRRAVSAVKSTAPAYTLTEHFLGGTRRLHFRDEWLPILSGVVAETRDTIRGTVFDTEVPKWWLTFPGQIYLCTNLLLLRRNVSIKRMFLVTGQDQQRLQTTLLNAYIQEQLGVKVSIASLESLPWEKHLSSPMLSVHDSFFAATHSPAQEVPTTDIKTGESAVRELASLYDEFFDDDRYSSPLASYLKRLDVPQSVFREANKCVLRLREVSNHSSLPAVIAQSLPQLP